METVLAWFHNFYEAIREEDMYNINGADPVVDSLSDDVDDAISDSDEGEEHRGINNWAELSPALIASGELEVVEEENMSGPWRAQETDPAWMGVLPRYLCSVTHSIHTLRRQTRQILKMWAQPHTVPRVVCYKYISLQLLLLRLLPLARGWIC